MAKVKIEALINKFTFSSPTFPAYILSKPGTTADINPPRNGDFE